jgi:hypothetical protein
MEPEEIKLEMAELKRKLEKRRGWSALAGALRKGQKIHKNCGGKVVYREPDSPTYYSYAGYCLRCEQFPISEEDIVFEGEQDRA